MCQHCFVGAHAGAPTFRQLLARVKAGVLSALVHSEVPFKVVMSALCQNASAQEDVPRFQSALNLEHGNEQGSLPGFSKCGLKVKRLQVCAEPLPFMFSKVYAIGALSGLSV